MDRRLFLGGLAAGVAGLLLPATRKIFLPLACNPLGGPSRFDQNRLLTATLFDQLMSRDMDQVRLAEDAINDYTRMKMREDGFFKKLLPPLHLNNDDLDRSVPAYTLSGPLPEALVIRGPRYRIDFDVRTIEEVSLLRGLKPAEIVRAMVADGKQIQVAQKMRELNTLRDKLVADGVLV